MNYKVPNFGPDEEISAAQSHLANTEKKLKHKLDWDRIKAEAKAAKTKSPNLVLPDFGMDHDIKDTQKNLKETEVNMNTKFTLD